MRRGVVRRMFCMGMLIVLCKSSEICGGNVFEADIVVLDRGVEQADEVVGAMMGCGVEVCETCSRMV